MPRRTRFRIFATTTTLVVTALALGLLTAGELEPPVPPGTPTMKPLPDLEPRHAIWAGMLPLTITQDGSSWYLAESITTTGGGITIAANDVTIDLMGHRLEGGTGIGIRDDAATAQRAGTTIKNGCVRNWGSHGISLDFRATVINVSAMENVGNGIQISEYGRFIDCRATFNSGHGLDVGGKAYVSGCQTHFNSENGILMNDGFVVNVSAVGNYRNGIRVWDRPSFATARGRSTIRTRPTAAPESGSHGISTASRATTSRGTTSRSTSTATTT